MNNTNKVFRYTPNLKVGLADVYRERHHNKDGTDCFAQKPRFFLRLQFHSFWIIFCYS